MTAKLTSVCGYSLAKRSVLPLQQSYTLHRTVALRSCAITLYALAIRSLSDRMLTVFNCFIIIIFLFCLMKMEYSVFKVEEKKDGHRNLFGTGRFI